MPETCELAADLPVPSGRVVAGHLQHEAADRRAGTRPSWCPPRIGPAALNQLGVPAQERAGGTIRDSWRRRAADSRTYGRRSGKAGGRSRELIVPESRLAPLPLAPDQSGCRNPRSGAGDTISGTHRMLREAGRSLHPIGNRGRIRNVRPESPPHRDRCLRQIHGPRVRTCLNDRAGPSMLACQQQYRCR